MAFQLSYDEGGRVGPHAMAQNVSTAADDIGAVAGSWVQLAGLPSCYAGLIALRC